MSSQQRSFMAAYTDVNFGKPKTQCLLECKEAVRVVQWEDNRQSQNCDSTNSIPVGGIDQVQIWQTSMDFQNFKPSPKGGCQWVELQVGCTGSSKMSSYSSPYIPKFGNINTFYLECTSRGPTSVKVYQYWPLRLFDLVPLSLELQ